MVFETVAAVDLGSNSFRLQVGRVVDDQIYPLDNLKSSVRLASGLTPEKRLDAASQQRALAALAVFGELLLRSPQAIKQVAQAVGFASEKSFMRAFRGWTGQSPADFRRQSRG